MDIRSDSFNNFSIKEIDLESLQVDKSSEQQKSLGSSLEQKEFPIP